MNAKALPLRAEAESAAAPFPPLLAEAERAASALWGVHGRRAPGVGETFWEYRRYEQSDPASRIDWRRSARSDRLFVRENEWEAANSVWIWVDGDAGMNYASNNALPTKARRAAVLGLALAILLVRGGERVALMGAAEPPGTGRAVVRRIADQLEAGWRVDLPAHADLKSNARIVVISDFLTPLEALSQSLKRHADAGARGALMQVLDPAEKTFPFKGRTLFEDVRSSAHRLFGRADAVRDAYRRREQAHRAALADLARALGWSCTTHVTDAPPQEALLALFVSLSGAPVTGRRRA